MKKQLKSELKEIAISILSNELDTDIETLKTQAASLYERLTILAYTEKHTSQKETTEAVNNVITEEFSSPKQALEKPVEALENQKPIIKEIAKPIIKLDTIEETPISKIEIETPKPEVESPDLLFELEELTAGFQNLPEFDRATKEQTSTEQQAPKVNDTNAGTKIKSSLNTSLNRGINIGLNDRLAFVKHLFNSNQDDYTRVISQLNTLESSSGAKNFIEQMVKPEYNNWEGKEAFEERFINIVFSKFDH